MAVALRIRDSDDYSDKTISDMASSPESISATGSLQAEAHAVEELQTCSQTWPIYAEMSATDSLSSNQFDASDSFSYRSDIDSEILKSGSSTDDGEDSYDGTEHCRSSSDSTATASIDTTSLSEHDKNLVYSLWEQHPLVVAAMQGDHGVSVPSSLPPPPSSLPPPPSSLPPTTSPPSSAAPMRPDMSTLNMTKLQRQDSDLDRQLSDQHLLNMQAATTRPPPVSGTATSRRNSVSMAVRDRSSILIPRSGARPRTLSVSTSSSSLLTPLSRSAGQNDGETTPCSTTTDSDVSPATATLNALAVISPRWTAQPDRLPFALPEKSSKFAINNSAYLTRARSHTVSSPKSTTAPRASVTTVEWEQSAPPSPSTPCAAEPAVPTARAARASTLHLQKFQPVSEPTMPVAAAVNLALELLSPRQRLSHSSSSPSLVTTPRQEVAVAAASVMASPRTTAAASPRAMPVLKSTASMSELVSPRAAPPTVVLSGAADLFFGSNTKPEKNAKETAGDVSPRTSKLKKVASKFRSLVVRSSSSSRKSAPVILTSPRVLNVSEPVAIAGWSASRDSTLANTSPLYALLAEAASELHKVPTTPRGTAIREPSGDDESPTDTELLSDTSGNVSGDDVDVDVDAEVEAVMGSALSSSDQGTYASGESTSTTPRKKSVIIKKDFERRLSVA